MPATEGKTFSFQFVGDESKSPVLNTKERKELLQKWYMLHSMKYWKFCFDEHFQTYQMDTFIKDFFSDPVVQHTLRVMSSGGSWASLCPNPKSIAKEDVPCTLTSMDFFDRLSESGVVRETGQIVKCFDEPHLTFTISDELRKMLLISDSDNYSMYSASERSEFLFRIFSHVCLGGAICQFEDEVEPYLDTAKLLYKDLVAVQKDTVSGLLSVRSSVVSITEIEGTELYPRADNPQNFFYLIVDPVKRHVTVWYNAWCDL
eukprot:Opistho-2@68024